MAIDIGYMSAVGAGALSFLSPCVLPLVPPYLCYMAGVSIEDFRGEVVTGAVGAAGVQSEAEAGQRINSARLALIGAAGAFVLGFSTVFIALGAGASSVGGLLRAYQQELGIVAGILIIAMGLNFLGLVRIPLLSREARFEGPGKPANAVAAYFMGLAFAFGWTPCIGPVLGPILTLAGGRDTVSEGAMLLAAYSLGLGIPFLLAALFSGAFMRFLTRFRVHLGLVEKAMGGLLVAAGVLFLTGGVQKAAYWLLETFPGLALLG